MHGGGSVHIFDMIARMKANQELRKSKSRFRKDFFTFDHEMSAHKSPATYQEKPLTLPAKKASQTR